MRATRHSRPPRTSGLLGGAELSSHSAVPRLPRLVSWRLPEKSGVVGVTALREDAGAEGGLMTAEVVILNREAVAIAAGQRCDGGGSGSEDLQLCEQAVLAVGGGAGGGDDLRRWGLRADPVGDRGQGVPKGSRRAGRSRRWRNTRPTSLSISRA